MLSQWRSASRGELAVSGISRDIIIQTLHHTDTASYRHYIIQTLPEDVESFTYNAEDAEDAEEKQDRRSSIPRFFRGPLVLNLHSVVLRVLDVTFLMLE